MKFTHPFSEYVREGSLGANEIHVIKEGLKYISHICPQRDLKSCAYFFIAFYILHRMCEYQNVCVCICAPYPYD